MKVWGIEAGFPQPWAWREVYLPSAQGEQSRDCQDKQGHTISRQVGSITKLERDPSPLSGPSVGSSDADFQKSVVIPGKMPQQLSHIVERPNEKSRNLNQHPHRAEQLKPADHACWETLREGSNQKRSPKQWHFTALATEWLSGVGGLLS